MTAKTILTFSLALLLIGTLAAFDIPAPEKWKTVGEETRLETAGAVWKLLPGTGKENGVWTGHAFALPKANYRISFRYRLDSGTLRFIIKHGDNSYSLLDKRLPATGGEWRSVREEMTETIPGKHGSIWFLSNQPAELSELSFERIASGAEQAMARKLTPSPRNRQQAAAPDALPDLRNTFLIAQEWHSWFHADTAEQGGDRFFRVWGYQDGRSEYYNSAGPLWRRAGADLIYPYLGFYSAGNPEVIRWQLRCMKNSGLDGVAMQLYPNRKTGRNFMNLEYFELCLKLAEEENFVIGIHDEIQFMPREAKEIDAFIERASSALILAKKYPNAFLRRNGKILYQYEAWNLPYSAAQHQQIMDAVEEKTGEKIYWMVCGPVEKMVEVEGLSCLKYPANTWSYARRETTRDYGSGGNRWQADSDTPDEKTYWEKWRNSLRKSAALIAEANKTRKNKLEQAVWIYPGFNNAGRWAKTPEVMPDSSYDRNSHFLRSIRIAQEEIGSAVINLSSWNDREEKTALEPSWSNESGDPFEMVRLLAGLKRLMFTEPPLPPKENVDPWMWSILYGIDRTPPRITGIRLHISEANLAVDAIDDLSGPATVKISAAPTAFANLIAGEAVTFRCTLIPAEATALKPEAFTPFELTLPGTPKGYGPQVLALKYRAPEKSRILVALNYPREVEHGLFRLDGERVSTIPAGPVLPGRGNSRWQVIKPAHLSIPPETSGKLLINLKFQPQTSSGEAVLEQIALFPDPIINESSRSHMLPSPGNQFRTFVTSFPDKLLPRNFTGIPFAVQAVDAEGNHSQLQVFDLSEEEMKSALGGRTVECGEYIWQ